MVKDWNELQVRLKTAAQIENPIRRVLEIAGVITDGFAAFGVKPVLVGGAAVEFYTLGNYMTRDIDMIVEEPYHIKEVMTGLCFVNDAGTWHLPAHPGVIVEFPKGPLAGERSRLKHLSLSENTVLSIISIEDLLLDRMLAAKYWKDGSDEWVRYMMTAYYDEVDWTYLRRKAQDELCLDMLQRDRRWARTKRKKLLAEEI